MYARINRYYNRFSSNVIVVLQDFDMQRIKKGYKIDMIQSTCKHFTLLLCNYYLSIQNVKISIKYFVICNIYVMS